MFNIAEFKIHRKLTEEEKPANSGSKTIESIRHFYALVLFPHMINEKDDKTLLQTQAVHQVISAAISDPRGVINIRNTFVSGCEILLPNIFAQLEATFGKKFQILRLINDLVLIGTLTESGIQQESQDSKSFNPHYAPDIEEEEVAVIQQKRFKLAADLYFKRLPNQPEKIDPLQIFENSMGLLGKHPSVSFLVAMLGYKSGESKHLKYAYKLFEHAKQGILLRPTCVVLQSLIFFWATKFGQFDVHSPKEEKNPIFEDVNRMILNDVLDKLLRALYIAKDASAGPSAVETCLMIDLHCAISCVYFCQKWIDESVANSTSHFTQALNYSAIAYQPGQTEPQILLLRAGRALNLDVPNYARWKELEEMNVNLDTTWKSKHYRPKRPIEKIATINALWPTIFTDPLNAWGSGAPIWEIQESHGNTFKTKYLEVVKECWWYKKCNETLGPYVGLLTICEICGLDSTVRCETCKKVYYCSKECQTTDWNISHEIVCKKIC